MKGLIDQDNDALEEEQDKLNRELSTVENSLNVISAQNAQLKRQIGDKSNVVN